jgi:hypothetical protein
VNHRRQSLRVIGVFGCFGCGSVVAWLLAALVACGAPRAFAQPSMQTILTNGPVSNRLNIVVLSEGYTSSQLAQFSVDATNAVKALLSHPPYQEYSNYFNGYAIKVASSQSGSTHPGDGITNNTYFDSIYDPVSDKLLTIPPNWADANYNHGQGKVDTLLQTFMPNCQLPILLVNDLYYEGGSDGFYKTAIASTGALLSEMPPSPPGMLTHETGHVLANLSDEYTYTNAYAGAPSTEGWNTTQQTNRTLIKWNVWVSTNTPIPTPDGYDYGDTVIGLFQGAQYHANNWYRPELNCAMNSVGVPFCAVCSEALVLAIYQRVRPVDAFSPAGTNFSVATTQALAFGVTLLQPATHNLNVQWCTNGVPWTGATNASFTLLPQSFANGTNWVSAVVKDNTPLVRNDPTNLLSQTLSWTLNVSIPQLHLDSPRWLTGGKFAFRITGTTPKGVVVQSSTNLSSWGPVATNSLVSGQLWYTNSSASGSPRRFYRATTPP